MDDSEPSPENAAARRYNGVIPWHRVGSFIFKAASFLRDCEGSQVTRMSRPLTLLSNEKTAMLTSGSLGPPERPLISQAAQRRSPQVKNEADRLLK